MRSLQRRGGCRCHYKAMEATEACFLSRYMCKFCGHNVTLNTCSYARRWNTINIVWDAWIPDSVKAGEYKANEASFAVPAMNEAAGR